MCHGDYFNAIRFFLEENQYQLIIRTLSGCGFKSIRPKDIQSIRITLMKHGGFYHPALVTVTLGEKSIDLALNAAISSLGQETMDREVGCLTRLTQGDLDPLVPRVFAKKTVRISDSRQMGLFLGEWFSEFYEFHLSIDADGSQRIRVWDEERSPFFLNEVQTYALYHEAASLLTQYYNLSSFEQIFPWHHAAGDFVVRATDRHLSVRLITVRQYAPIFRAEKTNKSVSKDHMMAGLLVFLLNLSVRMRLDRLDGIGEIAWADDSALTGIWTGFLAGLASNRFSLPKVKNPLKSFESYLGQYSQDELLTLSAQLADTFHPNAPEVSVFSARIASHVAALSNTISTLGFWG